MKIAYFDCFSGISGDMILSALVDAGLEFEVLKEELKKLPVADYELKCEKVTKNGIVGTKVSVITEAEVESPAKMIELVEQSTLKEEIKRKANKILYRMAEAEVKVHGNIKFGIQNSEFRIQNLKSKIQNPKSKIKKVHFHELGSLDTIIDVVGAVIGIKMLGIDEVYSSPLNVGGGIIKMRHGTLPAPGPATCELLKGVPIYSTGIERELTTPTGAAIISSLTTRFGSMPAMKVNTTGYGAGDFEVNQQANLLRMIIGEVSEVEGDMITLIETNIDDLNPQIYEYCFERLFEAGALDVYLTPIIMKKSRPGIILSVIADLDKVEALINIIFKETTAIGVRLQEIRRKKLPREAIEINTEFGKIKAKKVGTRVVPEYEVCKEIAKGKGIPLKEVYPKIIRPVK